MAPDPALKLGLGQPLPVLSGEEQDARWVRLAEAVAEPNAFYSPDLLRPALDHLQGKRNVRLIEVFDGGDLIGLMPVTVMSSHGRLPFRNVANWMHEHCFYGAPIIRQGAEQAAWTGFLAQLDAARWAPNFLHLQAIDAAGANAAALEAVCAAQARAFREIGRHDRALLRSTLSAEEYWEANVRAKKRKEIRRLQKRLGELGMVEALRLNDAAELPRWCSDFLALEASGWKGAEGTAMSCAPPDAAFFREATAAALAQGRLVFLRLNLDSRAIAMLVNFRHGAGAFSFKIAIDETLGRFSPGVLIELENLRVVQDHLAIEWMDSCAAPGHPMIDSLWEERRSIAQYRVKLRGHGLQRVRRASVYTIADAAERAAAFLRRR